MLKKHIIFCIDSLEKGGAEKNTVLNSIYFKKKGYIVSVYALYRGGYWKKKLKENKINITVFGCKSQSIKSINTWITIYKLLKTLRKDKPHIVVGVLYHSSVYSAIAGKIAGIKIIISNRRDCGFLRRERPFHLLIQKLANSFVTHYIAISKAIKRDLVKNEGINENKISVVYNGVETPIIKKRQTVYSCTIGCVANFHPRKNQILLVHAAKDLIKHNTKIRFILYGRFSKYQRYVENEIKKYHLESYFHIEEITDNMLIRIQQFDIGVLCSTIEGLGTAAMEYMACGIPVIVPKVEGLKELVVNNTTGYFFKSNNTMDFVDKINVLVSNPKKRRIMGEKGRKRIESFFTLEKSFLLWEKIINQY